MRQISLTARRLWYENWGLICVVLCALVRVLGSWSAVYFRVHPIKVPSFFYHWRKQFLEVSQIHDPTGLIAGMFLGDVSQMKQHTIESFREAGTVHLLSASGFNCWIVGICFASAAQALVRRKPLMRERLFLFSMTGGAALFWLWSDQAPPVTRAFILILVRNLFRLRGIVLPFWRLLLCQYVVTLILVPGLGRNISFQLSFGCLFGMTAAAALAHRFFDYKRKPLINVFATYMSSTFGACIGVMPTTWIVFGEVSFTSLLTNWLAIPPVTFVIMPLALFQILACTHPIALPAANFFAILNARFIYFYTAVFESYVEIVPSLNYAPYREF